MAVVPDEGDVALSGRAFALHVKGPGFNPPHLQSVLSLMVEPECVIEHNLMALSCIVSGTGHRCENYGATPCLNG